MTFASEFVYSFSKYISMCLIAHITGHCSWTEVLNLSGPYLDKRHNFLTVIVWLSKTKTTTNKKKKKKMRDVQFSAVGKKNPSLYWWFSK